jgi:hypothetical protein
MIRADMDRAGKIDCMDVEAIGNGWCNQNTGRVAPACLQADTGCEQIVDVERQMPPVLLGRADREQDDLTQCNGLVHLGPGEVGIKILIGSRHSSSFHLQQMGAGRACSHVCIQPVPIHRNGQCLQPTLQKVDRLLINREDDRHNRLSQTEGFQLAAAGASHHNRIGLIRNYSQPGRVVDERRQHRSTGIVGTDNVRQALECGRCVTDKPERIDV